ncbi:hypothetical protein BC629DRAFT_1442561 [Irpex lacteus]|nr:hypothetical protein BC629DRAFT_1442561 [Irpex lacteus]
MPSMTALRNVLTAMSSKDHKVLGGSIATLTALFVVWKWLAKEEPHVRLHSDLKTVADKEYDVIIIGGGCVIASRLSEDPSVKVLLLEAGQSGKNNPMTLIPAAFLKYWYTEHEWGLSTEPQTHALNRRIYWPRGKLLGGCSNMNAMMFHYGAPSDYDDGLKSKRGSLAHQAGLTPRYIRLYHSYFEKFEKYSPSQAWPDVDVTLRGAQGLVDGKYLIYRQQMALGHLIFISPSWVLRVLRTIHKDFIEASKAVGIAHSHDINTHKGTLGVTKIMTYIDKSGQRVTAESAYLSSDVLARSNLAVATGAYVTRVLFDGTDLRATGVEFRDTNDTVYTAKAGKEVVLCAGAVHTPHILMLSGVGPAEHLKSVGVPVVANLPGVGSGLKDHASVDTRYASKYPDTLDYLSPETLRHQTQLAQALLQYKLTGRDLLPLMSLVETAAFVRTDDPALFPPGLFPSETAPEDTTTGKAAPDLEMLPTSVGLKNNGLTKFDHPTGYTFGMRVVCLKPKSSGTIRLKSGSPSDAPVIDPHYLEDPNDMKTLIRGLRLIDATVKKEPLASRIDPSGDNYPDLEHDLSKKTDVELEQFVRDNLNTIFHPACSARMAPLEDDGVVDPFLRVHGIPNLRIADASVFPSIVAGHTTAPVYAVAEKASDLIKNNI